MRSFLLLLLGIIASAATPTRVESLCLDFGDYERRSYQIDESTVLSFVGAEPIRPTGTIELVEHPRCDYFGQWCIGDWTWGQINWTFPPSPDTTGFPLSNHLDVCLQSFMQCYDGDVTYEPPGLATTFGEWTEPGDAGAVRVHRITSRMNWESVVDFGPPGVLPSRIDVSTAVLEVVTLCPSSAPGEYCPEESVAEVGSLRLVASVAPQPGSFALSLTALVSLMLLRRRRTNRLG